MSVSIVFGGQWGSEGKGKTTYYFSKELNVSAAVRVGGPNSGHTIVDDNGDRKAFRILPVASVLDGVTCVLPAGSYIDLNILLDEIKRSGINKDQLKINPNAVIINQSNVLSEKKDNLNLRIGSTESGMGMAVISRAERKSDSILARECKAVQSYLCNTVDYLRSELRKKHEIIIEGTQGFGLSLLHAPEYPFVTSRDTSAAAFLSEAGLSPFDVKNIIMTLRAFPIRVAGNSGPLPHETTWEEVSHISGSTTPIIEYTTVTQRMRRVAKFDSEVVKRSISVNQPNIIVLNHCDYFDYTLNNQYSLSALVEQSITKIEEQIGKIDYIGTGDSTIFKR